MAVLRGAGRSFCAARAGASVLLSGRARGRYLLVQAFFFQFAAFGQNRIAHVFVGQRQVVQPFGRGDFVAEAASDLKRLLKMRQSGRILSATKMKGAHVGDEM